ncbi:MAG: hypothetical protein ABFC63_01875 [Thermoguttaceae bacterium]
MKKLLLLTVLGTLLGVSGGCRIGECWRYAWNSRFHPERNCKQQTCVMVDPCDDPCSGETVITSEPTTVVTPAPSGGCNCGGGSGAVMPGPVGR